MPYVQYKNERGVLHIGEGRFFHAGEPQKVTAKERDELLDSYKDLVEVKEPSKSKNPEAGEVNA
ncbi:hypothetical protein V7078_19150 [Bacillus velezensis]|uniref:hypothetical protein n=1 Tax=Bacillus TaxID=1386 RepID=UPI0001A0B6A3|nr:hypothetical protein [Bacillus toyonensis]EEL37185.1 hypothetical protein bcere0020_53660 [Bacillus cereus Rock3-29]MCU5181598.1 hypothetical protein [Bacillus toyonensis]